jgi:hypothetical protein
MKLELTLKHDGKDWVIDNEFLSASAPTLEELDRKVKNFLKEKEIIQKGEKAKVFMAFDNSSLPQWIRQYSQHYFNRIIEIEG